MVKMRVEAGEQSLAGQEGPDRLKLAHLRDRLARWLSFRNSSVGS